MKYTVDYFIKKFEAIPEDNWITGQYFNPEVGCCALGWCGVKYDFTQEALMLSFLLSGKTSSINDGNRKAYPQPTPKQRILAALNDVKKGKK